MFPRWRLMEGWAHSLSRIDKRSNCPSSSTVRWCVAFYCSPKRARSSPKHSRYSSPKLYLFSTSSPAALRRGVEHDTSIAAYYIIITTTSLVNSFSEFCVAHSRRYCYPNGSFLSVFYFLLFYLLYDPFFLHRWVCSSRSPPRQPTRSTTWCVGGTKVDQPYPRSIGSILLTIMVSQQLRLLVARKLPYIVMI